MKILRVFFIVTLLLALSAGLGAWFVWQELNEKIVVDSHTPIQIPRGATTDQVMAKLQDARIIKNKQFLKLYIKLTGTSTRIMAGDYFFPSPISALGVLEKLGEGGQGASRITVIEGWNRWDIADAMLRIPSLKLKNASEALRLMDNTKLIKDLDSSATNLEGYLYPDTYFVYTSNKPREINEGMVKQFRDVWQTKLKDKAAAAGKSVHEIVTVASIIETEAKLPEERPMVASVIYNRLAKNMPLAVDSTIVYASKLAGKWKNDGKVYQSDIDRDSPYNTRKHRGLPPGPVGSPGLASLLAAINPCYTNFLYYVRNPARNDGAHNFYSTPQEFEMGVKALRDWEARQKR